MSRHSLLINAAAWAALIGAMPCHAVSQVDPGLPSWAGDSFQSRSSADRPLVKSGFQGADRGRADPAAGTRNAAETPSRLATVPEPGTAATTAIGLVWLAWRGRRSAAEKRARQEAERAAVRQCGARCMV